MSEKISKTSDKAEKKPRKVGRPKKGQHSLLDKRERVGEALSLHLQGYTWCEVREFLKEKYNIQERTAYDDCKKAKELKDKKVEPQEEFWIRQVIDQQFQEIDRLLREANSAEGDIARVQFRKLLKENRQYLWENFLLPNYFKQLRAKDTNATTPELYQALMFDYMRSFNEEDDDGSGSTEE